LTLPEVESVEVTMGAMTPEQRQALTDKLKAGRQNHPITFNDPSSLTRVIAVGSGKGGVGKSSVTANLAAAMAAKGLSVGVLDADIHGFSMTRMLGVTKQPTRMDDMLLPPTGNGVKVMSIGSFVPDGQAVVWRGPKMHRALEQFAADVFWGDLDVLLLDLPPGTGDVAISITQLLPTAELVVVTTPQRAAASVAERVGSLAAGVQQKITGVIENMSWLQQPDGTLIGGFNAGIGIEIALLIFMYRKYTLPVAILGGFLHTIPEWFYKLTVAYGEWSWPHKVELFGFYAISGVIMTGIGGYYLVRALADTGALNMFPAGRERLLNSGGK
ncbi:ECF transporter S component, partial [Dermabacteraceae bacterium P13101]